MLNLDMDKIYTIIAYKLFQRVLEIEYVGY